MKVLISGHIISFVICLARLLDAISIYHLVFFSNLVENFISLQNLNLSAVGLEFDTMSNLSETSEKKTEYSSKTSPEQTDSGSGEGLGISTSGIEPLSSCSKRHSEVYDSETFPKSLIDGYHR